MFPINFKRFILVGLLICLAALSTRAYAETIKISLLPGDSHTKLAAELVKNLDTKSLGINIKVYPAKDLKKLDKSHLRDSSLIVINAVARFASQIQEAREELIHAKKRGAKIYVILGGYPYDDRMKEMGVINDPKVDEYYAYGGLENLKNMLLYLLNKEFGLKVEFKEPVKIPMAGIYEHKTKRIFESFEEFAKVKGEEYTEKPMIGLLFYRFNYTTEQLKHIDTIIEALEREGFSPLPVFGFPDEGAIGFLLDEKGNPRIRLLVALSLKAMMNIEAVRPLLNRLGVPVINAITLSSQTKEEWERSPIGLDIFERTWQVGYAEMVGQIQPTIVASREWRTDPETGIEYVEETPIPDRVERLVSRVKKWIELQDKPNDKKRIALIYYNYPPGKQNVGASYLNVLPDSLWEIYKRLKEEGYEVGREELDKELLFSDIINYGRNIGSWAPAEMEKLVRSGRVTLLPVEVYKRWFEELPEGFRKAVIRDWGKPEDSNIMVWRDGGKSYFILPTVIYGNILFAPQPSRGEEQDVQKLYHDLTVTPHHQYIAFYLWLQREFKADAMVHIGTHATHEWLPGKEVGFTQEDPSEIIVGDVPQLYIYVVQNIGEGLQAKRRGLAAIIDHMTPPFDKAGLNKELRELLRLVGDYHLAKQKNPTLSEIRLKEINTLAKKTGILKDIGISEIKTEEDIEELEDYIVEIAEKLTPFGLHTFGKLPEDEYIKRTAEAMVSLDADLPEDKRNELVAEYERRIRISAQRELDSLVAALKGRFVPVGPGGDLVLNPDVLPTGKNFFGFDPFRIPSKSVYDKGVQLAKELIEGYKNRHGKYPDKITFILWAGETIRHEGVMESQILYLMGIKPKWDERGRVVGVEVIPPSELGRPRLDVVVVPSGLYRDIFPNLMDLLDKAVALAREQREEDNILRNNVIRTKQILREKGISEDLAERLASVRIFTAAIGDYSPGIESVIGMSNTWSDEKQIAEVFLKRMSYIYGQGFWGERIEQVSQEGTNTKEDINLLLFKEMLSGTKIALHSRSTNLYGTLDNDDFFQFLGGVALAVRVIDGKTPELFITNLSNPKANRQETLERFMGRELRSRYLNPEWIKEMMKEGYAGARFINSVVEYLWGWQVTTPEVVDEAKWNELYETYVLDKYELNIKELFRQANNLWAYQSILARMLEAIRKNYWKPERETVEKLTLEYATTVREIGLACNYLTCNNPPLTSFITNFLSSVPGGDTLSKDIIRANREIKQVNVAKRELPAKARTINKPSAPDGGGKVVEGFEMQETKLSSSTSLAPIPYVFLSGFVAFVLLFLLGWKKKLSKS